MKSQRHSGKDAYTMNSILDIAYAFGKSKVLLTACELNIFTALGDEEKTAAIVASEVQTDERSTERLMNALCAVELLNKRGDFFSNTKATRQFLVQNSDDFMGNLMHLTNIWDNWGRLTEAVRTGTLPNALDIDQINEENLRAYLSSLHWQAKVQAPEVIEQIYLTHSTKVLDLAGGAGTYAMEFVRAKPDLKVVVFEQELIIPFTQEYLEENGFADKIETVAGDYFTDDIGSGYDIVFMSSVIQNNSIWENIDLTKKVYDSLNPGGQIIIQDFVIDDTRTKPLFTALFSINQLVNTKSGDTYAETDIWIMLKEAWFTNIEFRKSKFGSYLIFGKK